VSLKQLITNPDTDRLSTSDFTVLGAFFVSSFALLWVVCTGKVEEWIYTAYLLAWVAQSQGAKWQARFLQARGRSRNNRGKRNA
jgi:hypothetical protein